MDQAILFLAVKAKEFEEKVKALQEKAEETQPPVPKEVGEAKEIFNSLVELAQGAQQQIKADSTLEDAFDDVDKLVELLTDEVPRVDAGSASRTRS